MTSQDLLNALAQYQQLGSNSAYQNSAYQNSAYQNSYASAAAQQACAQSQAYSLFADQQWTYRNYAFVPAEEEPFKSFMQRLKARVEEIEKVHGEMPDDEAKNWRAELERFNPDA